MGEKTIHQAIAWGERDVVQYGDTTIEYTVRRSGRRRKTIGIRLEHGVGVLVAAPLRASAKEIREIVLKRAGWIAQKTAEQALRYRHREFVSGESLLYLGHEAPLVIEHASSRRIDITFAQSRFTITAPAALEGERRRGAIEAALVSWYKARAAAHLAERVESWARAAGLAPSRVLVRDQRRRWGSCSSDGSLRFNWRIMMAPPTLVDYLVVHELAHLRVRNHSPAFWAEVARLLPDYKARRALLREIEPRLSF